MSDAVLQRLLDDAEIRDLLLAYMPGVHIPDGDDPSVHADIGGSYRCECARTAEGWRFRHVALEVWWTAGVPFVVEPEPAAGG